MKGIIFCDGQYEELLPITYTIPKELIPIANKPLIIYIIEFLLNAGVEEIGIIVNNHNESLFKRVINRYFLKDFYYIRLNDIDKIDYKTLVIDEFIKEESLLLILGNNSFDFNLKQFIEVFQNSKLDCKILLKEVDYPEEYNVAYIADNSIIDLEKKPRVSFSDLAVTGIYAFSNNILNFLREDTVFKDGLDIIDIIKFFLQNKYRVDYEILNGYWKDIKTPLDVIEENINRLNSINKRVEGEIVNSHISGKIILEDGAVIYNSVIRGPIIVDKNSIIRNSYIGPYTSIGKGVNIEKSNIENSIILNGCIISEVKDTIESSIIGEGSLIKGESRLGRKSRLIVGRSSKVYLKS